MQAAVRSSRGEDVTAFARIEDGSRCVSQGDVVRLNVKPALMGMVLYFSVQQVLHYVHLSSLLICTIFRGAGNLSRQYTVMWWVEISNIARALCLPTSHSLHGSRSRFAMIGVLAVNSRYQLLDMPGVKSQTYTCSYRSRLMSALRVYNSGQAVRTEGVYANGSVVVRPLPEEVHGTAAERMLPLRRLEGGPVERQELDEFLGKELLKVSALPLRSLPYLDTTAGGNLRGELPSSEIMLLTYRGESGIPAS